MDWRDAEPGPDEPKRRVSPRIERLKSFTGEELLRELLRRKKPKLGLKELKINENGSVSVRYCPKNDGYQTALESIVGIGADHMAVIILSEDAFIELEKTEEK